MNKIKVHAWQLSGYARLNSEFVNKLRNGIRDIDETAKLIGLSTFVLSSILQLHRKSKSSRIKDIFKVTNFLKLDRNVVESNIEYFKLASSCEWYGKSIKFPLEISPLWFRCVGIGDFSISGKYQSLIWHQNSVKPMKDLIKSLIGIDSRYRMGGYSGKNERIYISHLILDSICVALDIKRNEVTTPRFILSSINLTKPFKIQILAQTIVDDGYCDKIHKRVSIHMKNEKIIKALHMLSKSLGYKSTIVKRSTGKFSENNFYDLIFSVEGTFKFYKDLKRMIKIYGSFAGLWNKQDRLEEIVRKIDVSRLRRIEATKKFKRKVMNLIENGKITATELRGSLGIPRIKFFNIISELKREGLIKTSKKGIYSKCK